MQMALKTAPQQAGDTLCMWPGADCLLKVPLYQLLNIHLFIYLVSNDILIGTQMKPLLYFRNDMTILF